MKLTHYLKISMMVFLTIAIDCNIKAQTKKNKETILSVENPLNIERQEIVSVSASKMKPFVNLSNFNEIRIKDQYTNQFIPIQWIDYDQDGIPEEVIFQATLKANQKNNYQLIVNSSIQNPKSQYATYSRFVPERVDDYAWENDKIAFRMYGPKGQEEALRGIKSSTLSSGIDIWLKRTTDLVINDWYKGYLTDPLFYHSDKGKGYDPYHVGNSRGTGGSGIWDKDSLLVSENFVSYKTIAEGPLRTIFELTYKPWSKFGVKETKRITLDLGSNFTKIETNYQSNNKLPNYTVGISLHKNEGKYAIKKENGWIAHWEKIDDAFVGEGLLLQPKDIMDAFANISKTPDQSNLLIVTPSKGKLVYYAGFAWQKGSKIQTFEEWQDFLNQQAKLISNPLKVTITSK